jgi:hypothetical protein
MLYNNDLVEVLRNYELTRIDPLPKSSPLLSSPLLSSPLLSSVFSEMTEDF